MEGSSLSDPQVISLLNERFIPLFADIDQYGFPEHLPGLQPWRKAWKSFNNLKWGFATSVVVNPDGTKVIGNSGSGFFFQWKTATNYHPEKYVGFLQAALRKQERLVSSAKL